MEMLAENAELEQATEDFFVGVQAKEAPSPDHVPNVSEDDGFVNRREGLEEWPELWRQEEEVKITASVSDSEKNNGTASIPKHILQPKTRKSKGYLPQDPCIPGTYVNAIIPEIATPAAQVVHSPVRVPRPLFARKTKIRNGTTMHRFVAKPKRGARDSFVSKSTFKHVKPDGKSSHPPFCQLARN
jgi:hypothetical protein